MGFVPNKFPCVEMDVERMDEFNKELFVCLFAERRGREQKAAGMAAKRGGGGGGGGGVRCRPNGVVPQNRRGRRQTVRYVQIFHPQKTTNKAIFLASPAARHHYLRTASCFHRLGHF